MSLGDLTSSDAVLEALAEYDELGQQAFLSKYGFRPAKSYYLVHKGGVYDSKAIVGAAHGYQFPARGPLRPSEFSGGYSTVKPVLERLGFEVAFASVKKLRVSNPYYKRVAVLAGIEVHRDGWIAVDDFRQSFSELIELYQPGAADRWWQPFFHLQNDKVWTLYKSDAPASFDDLANGRPTGGASSVVKRADRARFTLPYRERLRRDPNGFKAETLGTLEKAKATEHAALGLNSDLAASEAKPREPARRRPEPPDAIASDEPDRPLRVLFLGAEPTDTARLRLGAELRGINEAILRSKNPDRIELVGQLALRPRDLQSVLSLHEPDIVHFSGHGNKDGILLEGEDGLAHPVAGPVLAKVLSTFKSSIRAVVLQACWSESQAEAITQHIDCAIGTSDTLSDSAAIAFAEAFYVALSHGRSLPQAFEMAVNELELRYITHDARPILRIRQGVAVDELGQNQGRRGRRPKTEPRYRDDEQRELSRKLESAQGRKRRLEEVGADTTAVIQEVLALKRSLRRGGQVQAGDILGQGRYLLLESLGRGGFSTVWKALDRAENDTLVAVKVLHSNLAQDAIRRDRFIRGARIMAELEHPSVIRVLEPYGEDDGFHYFVMELATAGTLQSAVRSGRIGDRDRMPIIIDLGHALAVAHERGYVHRDVKPTNVLMNAAGEPKLTDFDLVAAADTTGGTRTGAMGTFIYAAPEQLDRPQDADARADIYSLAMTAAFVLHGDDLPMTVVRDAPGFIRQQGSSSEIAEVLTRAVSWEPDRRFATMAEFCNALEHALSAPRS